MEAFPASRARVSSRDDSFGSRKPCLLAYRPCRLQQNICAYAFAQAILCDKNGCGECDDCARVLRRRHPDVHYYAPEGAQGYLVEQIREIVSDVSLAPIRAKSKVYILDRVDLLGTQAANAFLKTLEEPVPGVVFILLGRTREGVLPTIVSRQVWFRFRPAWQRRRNFIPKGWGNPRASPHGHRGVRWLHHAGYFICQK